MPTMRTYGDACGIPRALDVVGERWALMVVRELMMGPKRFTDLRSDLPRVSPDVLSQRLRELEDAGVLRRRTLPPPAASRVYELTPSGLALDPVLVALGRWGGANAPPPADGADMSLDARIISMRTLFAPELADDMRARVELRIGDQTFRAEVSEGALELERGEAGDPDATITTDPDTLLDLIHRRRSLADAVASGDAEVGGAKRLAQRFLGLFPLPAPA
jgi:DNA-binding HxlR family transcriptional regulator/putative sterol carrier protein